MKLLGKAGVVIDLNVVHPAKPNLAVITAIREVISNEKYLILDITMLRGITHDSVILVVLFRRDVEGGGAADENGVVFEYLFDFREHLPATDLVRVEDQFVSLVSLGSEKSESDHPRLVILIGITFVGCVAIFLP